MGEPLRILLIQSWVIPGAAIRALLRDAGYEPRIVRVDHEPALAAALPRGRYDLVLLDTASSGLPRSGVEALMREHGLTVPLVELGDPTQLVAAIRQTFASVRN